MIRLTPSCYYIAGNVNIGYITDGETGLLIDAGLEKRQAKQAVKAVTEGGYPLTHLLITHAHADHFGGADWLAKQHQLIVLAPPLEQAVLSFPKLEPLYLFQGNEPPAELRTKFLEGPAIKVEETVEEGRCFIGTLAVEILSLKGHSHEQVGVMCDGILYAADSYFGEEYLQKHAIPFIVDYEETIRSIEQVQAAVSNGVGVLPGHGDFEADGTTTLEMNLKRHQAIYQSIADLIQQQSPLPLTDVIATTCSAYNVTIDNLPKWALYRTAVTAYVTALVRRKEAEWVFIEQKLCVQSAQGTENSCKG
ncbi:MBL fold metallo-hydrolase [Salsuginibacillus kocurii]|uniref:MBL fold metallo-hydrolase n=1 Tax=Salsuginibacillus kocurii TaxID=427078 RepID=UPI00037F0E9C|nr:MBL fold metallo-hydrolase [Salsuginibacillus kocurii]